MAFEPVSAFSVIIRLDAVQLDRLKSALRTDPKSFGVTIVREMSAASQELVGLAQDERFTHPSPPSPDPSTRTIGQRTGLLRRSLAATPPSMVSDGMTLRIGDIGSQTRYFGVHEFGYAGAVTVREHKRAVKPSRSGQSSKPTKSRKKRAEEGFVTVKAHTRQVDVPGRGMLYAALEDHAQDLYGAAWARALTEGYTEALDNA